MPKYRERSSERSVKYASSGPCAGFLPANPFAGKLVCLKQYAEHPLGNKVQIDEPHGGAGVFSSFPTPPEGILVRVHNQAWKRVGSNESFIHRRHIRQARQKTDQGKTARTSARASNVYK